MKSQPLADRCRPRLARRAGAPLVLAAVRAAAEEGGHRLSGGGGGVSCEEPPFGRCPGVDHLSIKDDCCSRRRFYACLSLLAFGVVRRAVWVLVLVAGDGY